MAAPEKYKHIDFKPPQAVADAAKRGLEYRQKASPSNRGGLTPAEAGAQGIGSGVQRAVNLKNRDTISPEVIRQMRNFLSRSEKASSVAGEHKDEPWNDKGYVAWLLWGGDPAVSWVDKIIKQMDQADEKAKSKKADFAGVCLEGCEAFGFEGKDGRRVHNCVPVREASASRVAHRFHLAYPNRLP